MRTILVPILTAGIVIAGATAAVAKPSYAVTIATNHSSISYGSSITLSGKVTGGSVKKKKVTLYWSHDDSGDTDGWHKIGTDKLSKSGHYSKAFKPKEGGDTYVKVVMAKTSSHYGASAATHTPVKVYQWQSLWRYWNNGINVEDGTNGATAVEATGHINGTAYKHSLVINDGAIAGFGTYECKGFTALVGVNDGSSSAGGYVQVGQGALLIDVGVAKGKATANVASTLSTSAGLTITGRFSGDGGTVDAMVVANPRVKCNAPA